MYAIVRKIKKQRFARRIVSTALAVMTIAGGMSAMGITASAAYHNGSAYYYCMSKDHKLSQFNESQLKKSVVSDVQYTYTVVSGKACLLDAEVVNSNGKKDVISVPAKIDGISIYRIGIGCFSETNANEIQINNSVTLEPFCFTENRYIKRVVFGNGVKCTSTILTKDGYVNQDAFKCIDCSGNAVTTYPKAEQYTPEAIAPTKIAGRGMFAFCDNLESVVWSSSMETVPSHAFYSCSKFKSIKNTENIKTIGECAFADCCSLKSVYMPVVATVKTGAFANVDSGVDGFYFNAYKQDCIKFEYCSFSTPGMINFSVEDVGKVIIDRGAFGSIWAFDGTSSGGYANSYIFYSGNRDNIRILSSLSSVSKACYQIAADSYNKLNNTNLSAEDLANMDVDRGNILIYTNAVDSNGKPIKRCVKYDASFTDYSGEDVKLECYTATAPYPSSWVRASNNQNYTVGEKLNIEYKNLSEFDESAKETTPIDKQILVYNKGGACDVMNRTNYLSNDYKVEVFYRDANNSKDELKPFNGSFDKKGSYRLYFYTYDFTPPVVINGDPGLVYRYNIQTKETSFLGYSGRELPINTPNVKVNVYNKLENTSTASAKAVNKDGKVTITTTSTGGAGDTKYSIQIQSPNKKSWNDFVTDYDGSKPKSIKFTKIGTYKVKVIAEDKTGNKSEKIMNIRVMNPIKTSITSSAKTASVGSKVLIKATANNVYGDCTFAFQYQTPGSTKWRTYSTAYEKGVKQLYMKFKKTGEYKVRVIAKDSAGRTQTSNVLSVTMTSK